MQESASKQDVAIARLFYQHRRQLFTPSAVHERMGERWPITSVRRSITNLTDEGILEKARETRKGQYGRPEHCWKWRTPRPAEGQQVSMFAGAREGAKAYAEELR